MPRKRRRNCAFCGYGVGKDDYVTCDRPEHSGVVFHFNDNCWGQHVLKWHLDKES